jgi:hypothetical protein
MWERGIDGDIMVDEELKAGGVEGREWDSADGDIGAKEGGGGEDRDDAEAASDVTVRGRGAKDAETGGKDVGEDVLGVSFGGDVRNGIAAGKGDVKRGAGGGRGEVGDAFQGIRE